MENSAALEMSAAMNQGDARRQLVLGSFPKLDRVPSPHYPFPIGRVQENRGVIERGAPLLHRAVVMRMRNRDAAQSAEAGNQFDGGIVDQGDAIPKKIAVRRLQQQGALPDREFRDSADAD